MGTNGPVSNYKDLLVWQKAFSLVKDVYRLTAGFPIAERYGLVSQMRRAAVSVPSNVAEGQTRHTTREFIQFISHAEGSSAELETQLLIAKELDYSSGQEAERILASVTEVRKMLGSLRRKLISRHNSLTTSH